MVEKMKIPHNRAMDDKRTEPRYLVKEDAFVWDLHRIKAGYHSASIVDVSRNGMRLESARKLGRGTHIAIDFRGMIVCATVQYCTEAEDRFVMGVRINNVLDPLREEPERPSSNEEAEIGEVMVHAVAAPAYAAAEA